MIYITGDTHGSFDRVDAFCRIHQTSRDDVLVILGDAGINYWGGIRDSILKKLITRLPITLLCIHGNHEIRPENIPGYRTQVFCGGTVFFEPAYPNILFARDGEVFDLAGNHCLVIGGAYSVDKYYRIVTGLRWWADEQPNKETKERVMSAARLRPIDVVFSHTCPLRYIPTEMFLPMIDQSTVDTSTEQFLDDLLDCLGSVRWYCGHYHTYKTVDSLRFLFEDFVELPERTIHYEGTSGISL